MWVQVLVYAVLLGSILFGEVPDWLNEETRTERLNGWLAGRDPDFLPFVPFLLLFPLCWFGFRAKRKRPRLIWLQCWLSESPTGETRSLPLAWMFAIAVFALAFFMSWRTGRQFEGLPPAYHDEYSYLFQAETFLHGRWWYPSFADAPDLFDQLHVLNEGKFASRYFPGTGAWIVPFLAWGNPWLGHQLAQAFASMLVFWIGRELANSGTGLLAGTLFSLSPGLILFSNLLLAHHPTLIGLLFFLWAFLNMLRSGSLLMALASGTGLSFAMICRPMTAAGFALPYGIVLVIWWLTGKQRSFAIQSEATGGTIMSRSRFLIAIGLPLLFGFLIVFVQNAAITGHPLQSPYQQYTDIYTPRHVYGFNNALRGERATGPLATDAYDRWAQNLIPQLAFENLQTRLINSWRWTLGIVPLLAALFLFLLTPRQGDGRWWLIGCSIATLHLVHIPYWFSGIMGWHYVFETAPLWILLFAEVTRRLFVQWSLSGRWMMKFCWLTFTLLAVILNLWTIEPLWPARLDRGVVELQFPRERYANFREQIELLRGNREAMVFVIPDLSDVSMDYVTNPPQLTGPVLIGRVANREQVQELAPLFPERAIIVFDAKQRKFEGPLN